MLALPLAYGVAGTIAAMVPVNAAWRAPARGVMVWVEDNGIHTTLVLPKRAAGVDWNRAFRDHDIADPRFARHDHVAVSWGERGFFVGTPTWWDVRPGPVLGALVGSDATVLHVEHVARPVAGGMVRALRLRPEEYRRLAAAVWRSRGAGAPIRGYAGYDAFYPAIGRYDAVHTCNWWTGAILARAGVRGGAWTPFSPGVMRWLPPVPDSLRRDTGSTVTSVRPAEPSRLST